MSLKSHILNPFGIASALAIATTITAHSAELSDYEATLQDIAQTKIGQCAIHVMDRINIPLGDFEASVSDSRFMISKSFSRLYTTEEFDPEKHTLNYAENSANRRNAISESLKDSDRTYEEIIAEKKQFPDGNIIDIYASVTYNQGASGEDSGLKFWITHDGSAFVPENDPNNNGFDAVFSRVIFKLDGNEQSPTIVETPVITIVNNVTALQAHPNLDWVLENTDHGEWINSASRHALYAFSACMEHSLDVVSAPLPETHDVKLHYTYDVDYSDPKLSQ